MGCQTAIAEKIVQEGGDYVLAVKDNQPTLHQGLRDFFEQQLEEDFADHKRSYHETSERAHQREERRYYYVCPVPKDLPDASRWPHLRAIGLAISDVIRDGQNQVAMRYYIMSKQLSAKRFGEAVRSHWSIENRLHRQLDVSFGEDQSRIRGGHAAENYSILRRTALSLLKNETSKKLGIKNKRLTAALSTDYLTKALTAQ